MFAIRNQIQPDYFLRQKDLDQVMQIIHADGVMRGGNYIWSNWFEPDNDLLDKFENMTRPIATDWSELEPEFV